jgi:hypothetical protein
MAVNRAWRQPGDEQRFSGGSDFFRARNDSPTGGRCNNGNFKGLKQPGASLLVGK